MTSLSRQSRRNNKQSALAFTLFGLLFFLAGSAIFYFVALRHILSVVSAFSWNEQQATVIESRLDENSSGDGSTYKVVVRYEYNYGGQNYESDRYQFFDAHSSGRESKLEAVRRYRPGKSITIFVNPDDPRQAVIERGITTELFLAALFTAIFPLAGFGILYAGFRKKKSSGGLEPTSDAIAVRAEPVRIASGAQAAAVSPRAKFIVSLFLALFWNGILSVFIVFAVKSWLSGSPEYFLSVFLLPFAAVGLLLIWAVAYTFLGLFNPKTTVTFASPSVRLGERLSLQWQIHGRSDRIKRLLIMLEASEEATYRRGTSSNTDRRTFARFVLLDQNNPAGALRTGSASVAIPVNTMHTFDAKSNKVRWRLVIHGEIPKWPDVMDEYPVEVLPHA